MFAPEVKFCVKYLLEHGINSINFTKVVKELSPDDTEFELVKTRESDDFFSASLAFIASLPGSLIT